VTALPSSHRHVTSSHRRIVSDFPGQGKIGDRGANKWKDGFFFLFLCRESPPPIYVRSPWTVDQAWALHSVHHMYVHSMDEYAKDEGQDQGTTQEGMHAGAGGISACGCEE